MGRDEGKEKPKGRLKWKKGVAGRGFPTESDLAAGRAERVKSVSLMKEERFTFIDKYPDWQWSDDYQVIGYQTVNIEDITPHPDFTIYDDDFENGSTRVRPKTLIYYLTGTTEMQPLVVDQNMNLLDGYHRYYVLNKINQNEIRVVIVTANNTVEQVKGYRWKKGRGKKGFPTKEDYERGDAEKIGGKDQPEQSSKKPDSKDNKANNVKPIHSPKVIKTLKTQGIDVKHFITNLNNLPPKLPSDTVKAINELKKRNVKFILITKDMTRKGIPIKENHIIFMKENQFNLKESYDDDRNHFKHEEIYSSI
ncbi:MAG: hypothetical protein OEY49_20335, partial [Candidatus Heimdallarchaeota archaeon]|nr:hypothetical protein [Candidatus Heimdallarchaeota archaeon]